MSSDAIPKGGGAKDGIAFLSNPKAMHNTFLVARKYIENTILIVRQAKEPNPWKDKSDEEIAGEILKRIEGRRRNG